MPIPSSQTLALATAFAAAHETPWTRDPLREPQRFGVHHDDPPPWNRLRGPVHERGPCSGVVWRHGVELASWGQPGRSDQTFSVAETCLALLAAPRAEAAHCKRQALIGNTTMCASTSSRWPCCTCSASRCSR